MNTIQIITKDGDVENLSMEDAENLYSHYVNDFLTVSAFAEYFDFQVESAYNLIDFIRNYHNEIYK